MATLNTTATTPHLAGGYGPAGAAQSPEQQLRRAILACLLWEDLAYQSGSDTAQQIRALIPQVDPATVAAIAVAARTEQKLRHVPLLLAREMARLPNHKKYIGALLPKICLRADDVTEFLSIYWKDKRQPLSAQVKTGLAQAYQRFDAYQLAKYKQDEKRIKLRDPLRLVHPKPKDEEQAAYWKALIQGTLPAPDTWEVALSAGQDKKATWERLITTRKLGALAFLRNLRNMKEAKVDSAIIRDGLGTLNTTWLLPVDFLKARDATPEWETELETAMLRGLAQRPKLTGTTAIVVDVSGSMSANLSAKSDYTRLDAAAALAVIANEQCETAHLYATAGDDTRRRQQTRRLGACRGFSIIAAVRLAKHELGGGGIFTRQMLEWLQKEDPTVTRIIVISDSQDCDYPHARTPHPFAQYNYIADISAHTHGINYTGLWTAEISGWSESLLQYIAASEAI